MGDKIDWGVMYERRSWKGRRSEKSQTKPDKKDEKPKPAKVRGFLDSEFAYQPDDRKKR